ncbi:MAG TPA: hypothetical protein VGG48_12135 [Rhizomicrobium sp.]
MPKKEVFRVRSLAAWRENVALICPEALGYPRIYHFSLAGEALTQRFCRAMTLKNLDDIGLGLRRPLKTMLSNARMHSAPAFAHAEVPRGDGTATTWCDLVLPLYDGDMPGGRLVFASYVVGVEEDSHRGTEPRSPGLAGEVRVSA